MINRLLTAGAVAVCLTLLPGAARADETIEKPAPSTPPVTVAEVSTPAVDVEPPANSEAPAGVPASDEGDATANAESQPSEAVEPVVIDYNEADIQSALRTLATRAGINLIIGDEIVGKVTVHLEGVSYEDALRVIVESKGFAVVKDKNVMRIKTKESLDQEPIEVRFINLNYAKADDVKKTLLPLLSRQGKLEVDLRGNSVVISDIPSNLLQLLPLVEKMDTQTPQVMIETKFVETVKNPRKDLGLNWSQTLIDHPLSAGPFTLTKDLNGGPWSASTVLLDAGSARILFSYLSRDSDSELLANPRVVTADNSKAKIAIARQVPIPQFTYSETQGAFQVTGFEYKDIGIVLNVVPRINKNDTVTLEVVPEAGNQSGVSVFQGIEIPIIDNRTCSTTVLIKSGNTLAIGGLMRLDVNNNYTKVPLMGDLPGIGAMFRSKSLSKTKRELLIFLTPTIVQPDAQSDYDEQVGKIIPGPEVYTDDTWLPRDNAKPNSASLKEIIPFRKSSSQNFGPK